MLAMLCAGCLAFTGISAVTTAFADEESGEETAEWIWDEAGLIAYNELGEVCGISDRDYAGEIEILPEIYGMPVTAINQQAFSWCQNITGIKIPDSVSVIGNEAFYCCEKLTDLTLPSGLTYIGSFAFMGCGDLKDITIPAKTKKIDSMALPGQNRVTVLNPECKIIGDALIGSGTICGYDGSTAETYAKDCELPFESLGTCPFPFTTVTTAVTKTTAPVTTTTEPVSAQYEEVKEGNLYFRVYPDHAVLVRSVVKIDEDIVIPSHVQNVPVTVLGDGEGVFFGGTAFVNFKKLTIPDTVVSIEDGALSECRGIEELELPDSVKSIGACAFVNCYDLKTVILPESVKSIGDYAFALCPSLQSVTIMNPACRIADSSLTFNSGGLVTTDLGYSGRILGYSGSTAETYAKKYDYRFKALDQMGVIRYGDVNDDDSVDLKDIGFMRRALAGWDVTLNETAADVNKDGSFDLKDVVILRRYLAGGWEIELN